MAFFRNLEPPLHQARKQAYSVFVGYLLPIVLVAAQAIVDHLLLSHEDRILRAILIEVDRRIGVKRLEADMANQASHRFVSYVVHHEFVPVLFGIDVDWLSEPWRDI